MDGYRRYDLTKSLVEEAKYIESCKYAPGQSLAQIPLYLVGKLFSTTRSWEDPEYICKFFVNLLNTLITPLIAVLLFLVCIDVGFARLTSFHVAIIYAFCTMAFHYARFNANEPFFSLLLISSCYFLIRFRDSAKHKWFICFCCTVFFMPLNNYVLFPFIGMLLIFMLIMKDRLNLNRPHFITLFMVVAFSFVVILYYNLSRHGSPWLTGYHDVGFTTPVYIGLYGLLLSPVKSIFIYNPIIILSILSLRRFARNKPLKEILLYILVIPAYLLIIYSMWWCWNGGSAWGPRFLVPAIPFLMIPLGRIIEDYKSKHKWKRTIIMAFIIVSLIIQLNSLIVHYKYNYNLSPQTTKANISFKEMHDLNYSPFIGQFKVLIKAISHPDYFDLRWINKFANHPYLYGIIILSCCSLAVTSLYCLRKNIRD